MATEDLLRVVRALREQPREVHGSDTIVVQGPGGTYKIRMFKGGNGSLCLRVLLPNKTTVYSVPAVEKFVDEAMQRLKGNGTEDFDVSDLVHDDLVDDDHAECRVQEEDPTVHVQNQVAKIIQAAVRMWRAKKRIAALMEVQKQIVALQNRWAQLNDQCSATLRVLDSLAPAVPTTHWVSNFDQYGSKTTMLVTLMTATNLDRHQVKEMAAEQIDASKTKTSITYQCAKALTLTSHFPLLIGHLPLPVGTPKSLIKVCTADEKPLYMRCTKNDLSDNHVALTKEKFGRHWDAHLVTFVANTPDSTWAYDVFDDRFGMVYAGSLILSKFAYRYKGNVYPLVVIDSIATVRQGTGLGTRMMDVCRKVLLMDSTVRRGLLVAQCLMIEFWECRLEPTNAAKAVVMQLAMLYPALYKLDKGCIPRTVLVESDDDLPSPEKQKA